MFGISKSGLFFFSIVNLDFFFSFKGGQTSGFQLILLEISFSCKLNKHTLQNSGVCAYDGNGGKQNKRADIKAMSNDC